MSYLIYLTETMLYLAFSILMGSYILQLIPNNKKPSVYIRNRWLLIAVFFVLVCSFMPLLYLIVNLQQNTGISISIWDILISFEIGNAWIATLSISIFFITYIYSFPDETNKWYALGGILFTLVLICTISWTSHPASLREWSGFLYHSLHFAAMSTWLGILLMVSWFSKDHSNWLAFLKWFTPVAFACFGLVILSGFKIMTIIMETSDYVNSWSIDYGQALLIKHIILLPIIVFAFINGFG